MLHFALPFFQMETFWNEALHGRSQLLWPRCCVNPREDQNPGWCCRCKKGPALFCQLVNFRPQGWKQSGQRNSHCAIVVIVVLPPDSSRTGMAVHAASTFDKRPCLFSCSYIVRSLSDKRRVFLLFSDEGSQSCFSCFSRKKEPNPIPVMFSFSSLNCLLRLSGSKLSVELHLYIDVAKI